MAAQLCLRDLTAAEAERVARGRNGDKRGTAKRLARKANGNFGRDHEIGSAL